MSQTCPDWRALSAHRKDPRSEEPAGWQEALAHLDGCPACRREAPAADPTLVFRRLPGLDMGTAAEAAEVESMIQAVATLRTARRLETPERRARMSRASWKRWSAAAALVTVALSLGAGHGLRRAPMPPMPPIIALGSLPVPSRNLAVVPAAEVSPRFAADEAPVVEELNRPAARVYQMDGGKNLSVVMIVDERLDV